ncbi:unnamed protein product [Meganyctiphanes norvegica]|uniref:Alkaline phosphatase n=1 Tax=Meganyctiphanes norvegica TaxID=48144 RepID=A0AAV2RJ63_MEGNR
MTRSYEAKHGLRDKPHAVFLAFELKNLSLFIWEYLQWYRGTFSCSKGKVKLTNQIRSNPNSKQLVRTLYPSISSYQWISSRNRNFQDGINRRFYELYMLHDVPGDMTLFTRHLDTLFTSQRSTHMVWERLWIYKTYCLDKQVGDSSCTGTAIMTGVKANYGTVGLTGNAVYEDCDSSLVEANRQTSILTWAQKAGKETGIVTTVGVTNASPASLYAHAASRRWECDTKMKKTLGPEARCKDIGRQLVEDEPGRNLKVIFGGSRQELGAKPLWRERLKCTRSDGRNLVQEWMEDKDNQSKSHAYVTSTQQLNDLDLNNTEYIMGLFGERHTPYEIDRSTSPEGTPSLKQMTQAAITRLSNSKNGYFLMVEGGRIDHGLHDSKPRIALEELVSMDKAVAAALELINLEETLIIITADHSHSMTLSGYPDRGNDIFGLTEHMMVADGLPYTTLMFTSGPGWNFSWDGEKVTRPNLTTVDTGAADYVSMSTIPMKGGFELHGGEDVVAYAAGPMAHLFSGVQEQTFVAHVMGFAACIGPYTNCQYIHDHGNMNTNQQERSNVGSLSKDENREILDEEYLQDLDATETPMQSFQKSSASNLVNCNWIYLMIICIYVYNKKLD